MLSNGGALEGARILGPRTIAYMASDHLAPGVVKNHPLLWPGHGFGSAFACAPMQALRRRREYRRIFLGGVAGTAFWISPAMRCSRS